jgi:hypothetical protein
LAWDEQTFHVWESFQGDYKLEKQENALDGNWESEQQIDIDEVEADGVYSHNWRNLTDTWASLT